MEQESDEQVTLDFAEFDDEVVDPDGEPMGVVVVDGDYRPDLGEDHPVPEPPRPAE